MISISDASPLIVLSGVGLFSFLQSTFTKLHTTQAVFDEVVSGGEGLPGSNEVEKAVGDWIHIHPTPSDEVIATYRIQKNSQFLMPLF